MFELGCLAVDQQLCSAVCRLLVDPANPDDGIDAGFIRGLVSWESGEGLRPSVSLGCSTRSAPLHAPLLLGVDSSRASLLDVLHIPTGDSLATGMVVHADVVVPLGPAFAISWIIALRRIVSLRLSTCCKQND